MTTTDMGPAVAAFREADLEIARLKAVNTQLLAACQRSLQYVYLAHRDGKDAGLSESTFNLAKRDHDMITAAIKAATE